MAKMRSFCFYALLAMGLIELGVAQASNLRHQHLHQQRKLKRASPADDGTVITRTVYDIVTVTVDVYVTVYDGTPTAAAQNKVHTTLAQDILQVPQQKNVAHASHTATAATQVQQPIKQEIKAQDIKPVAPVIASLSPKGSGTVPVPSPRLPEKVDTDSKQDKVVSFSPTGRPCGQIGGKCTASDLTIYNDQGIGACGWANDTNSQDYFALAAETFGVYTNDWPGSHKNAFCGRMAMISVNGKEVAGMLTDKCSGCNGWSIDVSQSLWNKLYPGEANTRKFQVDWWFTEAEMFHGASD